MARGGAGKNDFFLRFGSDADVFSEQLVGDLTKARQVVKLLKADLSTLEKQTNGTQAKLRGLLGADLARRGGGGSGGSGGGGTGSLPHGGGGDPTEFYRSLNEIGHVLDSFGSDLKTTVREIVTVLGKVPVAAQEYRTSLRRSIAQQIAAQNREVDAAGVLTKTGTGVRSMAGGVQKLPNLTQAALAQAQVRAPAAPASGGVRVGAGVITHGFDRVVNKLDAIHDILKAGIPTRPGGGGAPGAATPRVGLTTPAATTAANANKAASPAQATPKAATSEQQRLAALDAQIAAASQTMERQMRLVAQLGGALGGEVEQAMAQMRAGLDGMKAEKAALEREVTGQSRSAQSAARRAAAAETRAALPDQSEEEYNEILRKRQILDKAGDSVGLRAAAGSRGANGISKSELLEMAKVLEGVGFKPQGVNSKSTKPALADAIVGAREQFGLVNGGQMPPELQLGRKVVAGKISDYMRELLGALNQAAVKTVEQAKASEVMSAFGLSGGSGYKIDENGQARVKGNAGLRVSPGLPSQAFGPNALHVTSAQEVLDARRSGLQAVGLEEAKRNAANPDFNPHNPALYDEITKGNDGGDTAKVAMHALAQLKESTKALDQIGDEFRAMDREADQLSQFAERAAYRLEKAATRPKKLTAEQARLVQTDPENLAAAQVNLGRLHAQMDDPRYAGLQGLFRSPDYQSGRAARAEQEAANQARQEEAAARRHYTAGVDLGSASGTTIAGTRLAPGTAQTYVRNIPGARYNDRLKRYEFTDDALNPETGKQRPQSELTELNKHAQSYNAALQRESSIRAYDPDNIKELEKARNKVENKATAFLNEMSRVFGISPSFASITSSIPNEMDSWKGVPFKTPRPGSSFTERTIQDPENQAAENARQRQRDEVQERATRKFTPKDADTILAEREATLAKLLEAEQRESKRLTAAKGAVTRAETKLEKAIEGETAEEKTARQQRAALAEEVGRRNRRAQQAEADAGKASTQFVPATKNAASYWQQGPLMESGAFTTAGDAAAKARRFAQEASDRLDREAGDRSPEEQAVLAARKNLGVRQQAVNYLSGDDKKNSGAIERQRDRLPQSAGRLADKLETAVKAWDKATTQASRIEAAAKDETKALLDERKALLAHRDELYAQMRAAKTGRPEGQVGPLNQFGEFGSGGPRAGLTSQIKDTQKRLTEIGTNGGVRNYAEAERKANELGGAVANIQKQITEVVAKEESNAKVRTQATSKEATNLRKQLSDIDALAKQRTELRAKLQAANKAGNKAEADALRDQLTAVKAQIPDKKTLTGMRSRLNDLDNAAGGGGGGKGGGSTADGAAGGNGPGGNSLLRQILNELKALHTTVKSKRGGGGRKEDREPTVEEGGTRLTPTQRRRAEVVAGTTGTEDEQAKAAIAQQRRLKLVTPETLSKAQDQAQKINEQRDTRAAAATKKSTQATRDRIRTEQELQAALRNLDSASKRELENLSRLVKAGASDEQIVMAQARAYAALDIAMLKAGTKPQTRREQQIKGLLSDAQGTNVTGSEVQAIGKQAKGTQEYANSFKTVDQAAAAATPEGGIFGEQSAFTQKLFGKSGFWSRVMSSTGTFVVRNFTAGFVFGLTNALQEVIKQAILTESTFIRVSDALDQTGRSTGNLRTQLQGISSKYGTNLEDVYQTAAGLVGLFDSIDDIAGATKVVSELQMISGGALNAQEAMGALASITGAYGDQLEGGVDGLSQVADVLTVVQNVIGTNIETTAEGVASLSGLSKQLKIDFQDTAVYVAQISKLTNQTGAAAGDQFGRILAAMQTGRGRTALTKALPGTGIDEALGSGNYGQALQILLKNWNKLTDAQQRNISTAIAGQRQARAFAALTANTTKTLNAQAEAHDANGEAQRRAEAIARQLNVQIQKLGSNFQNFAQNLIRTGILDFAGAMLKGVNLILSVVDKLLSAFNDLADSNPLTKFLKNAVAGLIGLGLALKVGGAAFAGFKASIAGLKETQVVGAGLTAAETVAANSSYGPTRILQAPGNYARGKLEEAARPARLSRLMAPYVPGVAGSRTALPPNAVGTGLEVGRTAKLADQAERGIGKVNSGLASLGAMGPLAQLGILAVVAALAAGIDSLKKSAQLGHDLDDLYKQKYTKSGRDKKASDRTQADETAEYIGPFTAKYQADVQKRNKGFLPTASFLIGQGIQGVNPAHFDSFDDYKRNMRQGDLGGVPLLNGQIPGLGGLLKSKLGIGPKGVSAYSGWKGDLPQNRQNQFKALDAQQQKLLESVNQSGINDFTGPLAPQLKVPKDVAEKATKGLDSMLKNIRSTRASIEGDKSLSSEQRARALAELEAMQKNVADKIASIQLTAKGVKNVDQLTVDQLTKVGQMSDLFGTLSTSGSDVNAQNPKYKKLFDQFLSDTGVRKGSPIGKDLTRLMNGRLTKSDALVTQMDDEDKQITQLTARYEAAQKAGLEQTDVDAIFSQLSSLLQKRAADVQTLISTFFDDANALSDGLSATGQYGLAASTLRGAGARSAAHRDRATEDPVTRAQRDAVERSTYEKSATVEAQGLNVGLETSKARGLSAKKSADADKQIAANQLKALRDAKAAAAAVGAQGPSADAIHQAKVNWLNANHAAATAAQDANITRMTAATAGIWNSVALGAANEAIALQQYKNAVKNTGKNSAESAQAWAAVVTQRKSNMQNQMQIDDSMRQAAISAIPQGDAVRIARANVSAAQAAVREARSYGVNSTEYQGALSQLYSAQQTARQAQQAVATAQASLAQAYAEARGDAVGAAKAAERSAQLQLRQARANSGGVNSADVINAKAAAVSARAATRDAILQDHLDTIDFNLEMGKTTQSSAIAAMQQILRTANLTKQQRRDLLLKIKGMKDEITDGPWNFDNISLPTPYQMRRYIAAQTMNAAQKSQVPYKDSTSLSLQDRPSAGGEAGSIDNRTVYIDGADTAKVRAILEDVLGKSVKTRTTQGRRR